MSDREQLLPTYVDAAARLTQMPLTPQRREAVITALTRVATFAAHLESFELADEPAPEPLSTTGSAA